MLDRLYLLKLIGEVISIKYEQASYYLSRNGYVRDKGYKEILDKIREFIIIEDKIISAMKPEELEALYDTVEMEFINSEYSDTIVERIYTRVCNYLDYNCGECVKSQDIDLEGIIPEDSLISIADIIRSKFSIDMFKILNRLINSLKPSTLEDKRFIERLKREQELSKGELFAKEVSLETISMFYDNDIDSLPDFDFKVFNDLAIMSENSDIEDIFNSFLTEEKDKVLGLIYDFIDGNNMIVIENSPECVYEFLMVIARIEVIIPYLSKKKLKKYLKLFNENIIFIEGDMINVTHIKNMIRKRLKEI